ncbi:MULTISPECIES: hypothetical protein [unclassified Pseudoalteromonas]|uniref:hypothetical protein n=1 Tax=unclassified Pseudoalteromonas TaxID=194690 RepID=UPI00160129FC|nr:MULTISPECIES: hypothetical protein [unclassified Pseudoalteromonas]MBB1333673.1 hypothetical protein [Pseudoalteromonas sp. SR41-6]MBB1459399.1 hypothetical protein [Pseudoalteromonas sp. SG41-8]
MSDKLTDHDIASLYKRGATEQPSLQLDEQILQHAAEAANANKVTNINKRKRFYQTWYGQLSTAASLVLVAVLYMQNTTQYLKPSEAMNDLQILADEQTALAPAALSEMMQSEVLEQKQLEQLKQTQRLQRSTQSYMAGRQFESQSMTAKSEVLLELEIITAEVANKFKRIDKLIADGETTAAKAQLAELLVAHPELKVHLTEQYKQLLQ